eukprot:1185137-Prorocentrum_minimum.AAC.6
MCVADSKLAAHQGSRSAPAPTLGTPLHSHRGVLVGNLGAGLCRLHHDRSPAGGQPHGGGALAEGRLPGGH